MITGEYNNKSLLEIGKVVLVTLDAQGRITGWNKGAERLFGTNTSEVIGKPLANFLETNKNSTSNMELVTMLQKSMGVDHSEINEFTGLKSNGSRFPLELELRAQQTDSGPVYTVVMVDISRRRALEVDLQNKSMTLELMLDQCKNNLKAPYCFSQGLIQLLKLQPLNEESQHLLNMLCESLTGGKQLLDDLTTVSIFSTDYNTDDKIELNSFLRQLNKELKECEKYENLSLHLDVDAERPYLTNEALLKALIKAVIRYVIKFEYLEHPEDGPSVSLKAENQSEQLILTFTVSHLIPDLVLSDSPLPYKTLNDHELSRIDMSVYLMKTIIKLFNGSLDIEVSRDNCSEVRISLPNQNRKTANEKHSTYRSHRRQQDHSLFESASD
ncbi:PAS domain-containing protein [Gilvibacter sediminis]|uniref:PAS domain-containing protein n=1 Tax=Gilvibacter sediminis TaxID=379071 RepID=UPI00234FF8BE|nr:PAS domain-containing protein [Gilvibacter sediminis]MDC7997245.1 PAS domain-containing protein [Gilvibacter sediminis]